jgi:hypothetical protein
MQAAKGKYLEDIFKQKAVLHSTIRLQDKKPYFESTKFKRELKVKPYIEPTISDFLGKEQSKLR